MNRDIGDYQSRYAQQAFESWMVRFRKKQIRDILTRYPHDIVLEVGCGPESIFLEIDANIPVFEFGTSTENGGHLLNEKLIFQKEGFGGRGIVYDTYEWSL